MYITRKFCCKPVINRLSTKILIECREIKGDIAMFSFLRNQQTRAFIPLLLIIFIDSLGHMLTIPVFLRLFTDQTSFFANDLTPAMQNILFSLGIAIGPFGYMIGAPIIGTWSDGWGRKPSLVFSLILSLVGFILPIIGIMYSSLSWIFLGRFIAGIASSSQSLAQTAVGDISKGKEKAWYFAIIAVAMTLSLLVGPTMGAYLSDNTIISWFSISTPLYATLLLILFTLVLTIFLFQTNQKSNDSEKLLTLTNFQLAIRDAFSAGKVRQLFFIFFLYELGWSFYYQDIALYLTQKFNYSVTSTSHFLAYTGIWMALGLSGLYKIVIRYMSLYSVLVWSLITCALSFTSCAFAHNPAHQWIFIVPGAIGVGMAYPTIMTLLSDSVDKEKQGWVLGFAAAAFSAPWGISALLVGPLSNINLTLPLIFSAGCLFWASGLSFAIARRKPYSSELYT